MTVDTTTVVAACAALAASGGIVGWAAKHFVRDVVDDRTATRRAGDDERTRLRRSDEDEGTRLRRVDEDSQSIRLQAVTAVDLEAALARHEIRLLDKFNGRYPTKEVFTQGMENVREGLAETRDYIGDVKRELSAKIDGRIGGVETRIHDLERKN